MPDLYKAYSRVSIRYGSAGWCAEGAGCNKSRGVIEVFTFRTNEMRTWIWWCLFQSDLWADECGHLSRPALQDSQHNKCGLLVLLDNFNTRCTYLPFIQWLSHLDLQRYRPLLCKKTLVKWWSLQRSGYKLDCCVDDKKVTAIITIGHKVHLECQLNHFASFMVFTRSLL